MASFDRPSETSRFFKFVSNEFLGTQSETRRFFLDKSKASQFVRELGFSVPERYSVLNDVQALALSDLGRPAALKYGLGWSSEGVMLLEGDGKDKFFDHLSLNRLTIPQIVDVQKRIHSRYGHINKFWIIEEFLEPACRIGRIPFDYKFYTFSGEIEVILQIDRNCNPPKLAIFDSNFFPFKMGRDYVHGNSSFRPGQPIVPVHAEELLSMAKTLSIQTGSPFVSIDLYDARRGPVFGEFTFSPGAIAKNSLVYSAEIFKKMEGRFNDADDALSKRLLDPRSSEDGFFNENDLLKFDTDLYERWSNYFYNGGPRGALRLADYFWDMEKSSKNDELRARYRFLKRAWAQTRLAAVEELDNPSWVVKDLMY